MADRKIEWPDLPRAERSPLRTLLDLIYLRRCLGCNGSLGEADVAQVCSQCQVSIEPLPEPLCPRCANPMGPHTEGSECQACRGRKLYFRKATAAAKYDGPLREMIHHFKYKRCSFLHQPLGRLLSQEVKRQPYASELRVVVPVPLHWRRQFTRGYNQSALLAKQVVQDLRLPIEGRCLKRIRATVPQTKLDGSRRRKNISGAFEVIDPHAVEGKTVLLVDDVITTCSTLAECAKVLRAAGARRVYAAAVAR